MTDEEGLKATLARDVAAIKEAVHNLGIEDASKYDLPNVDLDAIPQLLKYETPESLTLWLRVIGRAGIFIVNLNPLFAADHTYDIAESFLKIPDANLLFELQDDKETEEAVQLHVGMVLERFIDSLRVKLDETLEELLEASIFTQLRIIEVWQKSHWESIGRPDYKILTPEVIKAFHKYYEDRKKKYVGAKVGRGRMGKWFPENRAAILNVYEVARLEIAGARKLVRKAIKKKNINWEAEVKEKYPALDRGVLEALIRYGERTSDIALEFASRHAKEKYGIEQSLDHLRSEVLPLARREREEKEKSAALKTD